MGVILEFKLTGATVSDLTPPTPALWQHVQGLAHKNGGLGALICPAGKVWSAKTSALRGQDVVSLEEVQQALWKQFFASPLLWLDYRWSKPTPRHPDFRHKESKAALWLNNRHKPGWVDAQLAARDAETHAALRSGHISIYGSGALAARSDSVNVYVKLCEDGRIGDAVDALDLLLQRGRYVPNNLFYRVLRRCISDRDLGLGTRVHVLTVDSGHEGDPFLATHLIGLYASHGRLDEAMRVFAKVSTPDAYNWATIIFAYARHGGAAEAAEAIRLYRRMCKSGAVKSDDQIYLAVLKACAAAEDIVAGKEVHAAILEGSRKPGKFVEAGLVSMYAKCGSIEDARRLFDNLVNRDIVTWNAMIAGYAKQGIGQESLQLYRSMQQEGRVSPNSVTYVCLLQACASLGGEALDEGKHLHAKIEEANLQVNAALGGSLVNMYAKCGSLEDARSVFDKLSERNVVAWTAMLAGYAQQGMGQDALSLYSSMQQEGLTLPDSVTYICLLQACGSVGAGALDKGKQLHSQIEAQGLEQDVLLGCSLVNMYAKCGSLEDARKVFDKLPERSLVACNTMLGGYAQQGMCEEALSLYSRMQQEGLILPDSVTYICLLQACAAVAALPLGEQLHAEIEERQMQTDGLLGAALVNMYAKCGSMYDSQRVFDSLAEKTIEAWGALMSGYARHGDSQVVFDLLDRMKLEGVRPDEVIFLSVMTLCSHVGLVDKGQEYFAAMKVDYGISATLEHYICMVDLLGRAGRLEEALQMTNTMPFPPNDVVWHTLLGACRKWKNVEIGRQAYHGALLVDEKDAVAYVLMSNIYASRKMWDAAREMQGKRSKVEAWKKPGQSWWTDMGGVVHTFRVGDKKHPESDAIYERLKQLMPKVVKEGYVPHLDSSLLDMADDEKESGLCGHSEKLAIAYALNKTAEGTTIRIVKNLRVCEDCHTATAYISKVEKRTIICRDASRFHVFKDGQCSCGDYW